MLLHALKQRSKYRPEELNPTIGKLSRTKCHNFLIERFLIAMHQPERILGETLFRGLRGL